MSQSNMERARKPDFQTPNINRQARGSARPKKRSAPIWSEGSPAERRRNPASQVDAIVIATMDPYEHREAIETMAKAGVAAFAMELLRV